MVLPLTLALPMCVHLPYSRHVNLVTKIYGLLQLIIISTGGRFDLGVPPSSSNKDSQT